MNSRLQNKMYVAFSAILFASILPGVCLGQGIFLPGSGAVNRGMGGATTGASIEALGSMYWNPATISHLPTNEMAFGFETLYTNYSIDSTFPGAGSGSTDSDIGANPVPTIAWVHHTQNPNVTFGLGIFGVAGFSVNMRGDPTNPIVSPPFAQGGAGVGGIKSDAIFFQMNPAIALKLTDRLSFGFGPTIGMGKIALDENPFVAPNANGLYPRGDGTRYHWGLGAQAGFHYLHNCNWQFGTNVKTPTWFESFRYFSEDANGLPRTDTIDVTLPLIISSGTAYTGLPGATLTADVRYLNYADTDGLGTPGGYRADGSVTGLGYRDQFAVALGAQFDLTCRLIGRVGYTYASDLINDEDTFFNLASDLSYQHITGGGFTYHLSESVSVSGAYNYIWEWGSAGPYNLPGVGPVPGSAIAINADLHVATIGVNVRY